MASLKKLQDKHNKLMEGRKKRGKGIFIPPRDNLNFIAISGTPLIRKTKNHPKIGIMKGGI